MKLVMDADCLIKLTKAKLKEDVCANFSVVIPPLVKKEVVDNAQGYPDSAVIERNLENGILGVAGGKRGFRKGEQGVLAVYQQGTYDAVCSDDKRFIKRLRLLDIPYITPAVFILLLVRKGALEIGGAHERLEAMSPYVNKEEYAVMRFALENWRPQ